MRIGMIKFSLPIIYLLRGADKFWRESDLERVELTRGQFLGRIPSRMADEAAKVPSVIGKRGRHSKNGMDETLADAPSLVICFLALEGGISDSNTTSQYRTAETE